MDFKSRSEKGVSQSRSVAQIAWNNIDKRGS
jgi:hypothetical protein